MVPFGPVTQIVLEPIVADEQEIRVTLHVAHDGIELVGRLFFADPRWNNHGIPDRGMFPGRTLHEVEGLARRLRTEEIVQRYRRANAEKRRFHGLRRLTMELLAKVRYMNQVAVSVRTGLLDRESAAQELELTEGQMLELVRKARHLAGIEG